MADFVNRVHVSPGIYASESVDMKTAANSIGITKLAVVGETLKGPAFQPYWIHSPKEFSSVFGGTSPKKFPGSNYPQYELPYIANEYLKKSTELCVVRTLGVSGYNAGPAWVITGKQSTNSGATEYVIAVLRSRGGYKFRPEFGKVTMEDGCPCTLGNDSITFEVGEKNTLISCNSPLTYNMDAVSLSTYTSLYSNGTECTSYSLNGTELGFEASYGDYGRFTINCIVGPSDKAVDAVTDSDDEVVMHIPVSLNKTDKDYILNVLGTSNNDGDMPLYVESLYDVAWADLVINNGYDMVSQDLTKYNVGYPSDFGGLLPVNSILAMYTEELKKKDLGKRFLYTKSNGSPEGITYYLFDYSKGAPIRKTNPSEGASGLDLFESATCEDGHIYTVAQITDESNRKHYVYMAYSPESTSQLVGDEKIMAEDYLLTEDEVAGNVSKRGMLVYNNDDNLYYKANRGYSEIMPLLATSVKSKDVTDISNSGKTFNIDNQQIDGTFLYAETNKDIYEYDTNNPKYQLGSKRTVAASDFIEINNVTYARYKITAAHKKYQFVSQGSSSGFNVLLANNVSGDSATSQTVIPVSNSAYKGYEKNGRGQNLIYDFTEYGYFFVPATKKKNAGYPATYTYETNFDVYPLSGDTPIGYYANKVSKDAEKGYYKLEKNKEYLVASSEEGTQVKIILYNTTIDYHIIPVTCDLNNYKTGYRYSSTPWVVSNAKGDAKHIELNKLFRFHTISDGNGSVTEVKVSIENIRPDSGEFDVVVRDYNDSDSSSTVLESFRKCTMGTDKKSIAYKIGTIDGQYESKSKYITVEVANGTAVKNSVPAGFLGYPVPCYDGAEIISSGVHSAKIAPISYNKVYNEDIQKKKQYFGISELAGYDYDFFSFKGVMATLEDPMFVTNGFHLDCRVNENSYANKEEAPIITVDGVEGYVFDTVSINERTTTLQNTPVISSEADMEGSIYEDGKLRKFTMVFAGGFDGWDVYREQRTNTDEFSYSNYGGNVNTKTGEGRGFDIFADSSSYGIDGRAITSDYYATLAGVSMLKNPEEVDINLLATPGIDTLNNTKLVEEVFNILEDRADTFYIVTTPDKEAGASDYVDDIPDVDEIADNFVDKEVYSDYAATYYPWVKIEDNGEYVWLPATRDVVRNLAETDNTNTTMNLAPAGTTRGRVNAIRARKNLKNGESDELYEANINPVRTYAQEGLVIMGQKTLRKEDDLMNRVDVRRMVMRMRKLIAIACLGLIFEPNDNNTVKAFKSIISGIMQIFVDNRAIEKWTMDVDDSQEARDRLEIGAVIYIKPIRALEYITLNFVVTNNDVYFED